MKWNLATREDASEMVLTVLIWGVLSLLSTRLYLQVTNYPTIGRGDWHVAHALVGGLIMIGGMLAVLSWHGERIRKIAAAVFGIGMGLFLDEIGKYLSSDNDYFFRPAIILIYIIFVLVFLIYRYFNRNVKKDAKTLLFQAITKLEDLAENDLEQKEKESMVAKLKMIIKSQEKGYSEMAGKILNLAIAAETIQNKSDSWSLRTWKTFRSGLYARFFKKRFFWYFLAGLTIVYFVGGIMDFLYLIPRFKDYEVIDFWFREQDLLSRTDIILFSSKAMADAMTAILFVGGLFKAYQRKIEKAIIYFQYGLLINIFLSSVFKFYFEQFSGVFGLAVSIVIFWGLSELRSEIRK